MWVCVCIRMYICAVVYRDVRRPWDSAAVTGPRPSTYWYNICWYLCRYLPKRIAIDSKLKRSRCESRSHKINSYQIINIIYYVSYIHNIYITNQLVMKFWYTIMKKLTKIQFIAQMFWVRYLPEVLGFCSTKIINFTIIIMINKNNSFVW